MTKDTCDDFWDRSSVVFICLFTKCFNRIFSFSHKGHRKKYLAFLNLMFLHEKFHMRKENNTKVAHQCRDVYILPEIVDKRHFWWYMKGAAHLDVAYTCLLALILYDKKKVLQTYLIKASLVLMKMYLEEVSRKWISWEGHLQPLWTISSQIITQPDSNWQEVSTYVSPVKDKSLARMCHPQQCPSTVFLPYWITRRFLICKYAELHALKNFNCLEQDWSRGSP